MTEAPSALDTIYKLTPVGLFSVALIGAWIASQQALTARIKLRLDLYEKRLPVFEAIASFFSLIEQQGAVSNTAVDELEVNSRNCKFLFNRTLNDELDSLIIAARYFVDYQPPLGDENVVPAWTHHAKSIEDLFISEMRLDQDATIVGVALTGIHRIKLWISWHVYGPIYTFFEELIEQRDRWLSR